VLLSHLNQASGHRAGGLNDVGDRNQVLDDLPRSVERLIDDIFLRGAVFVVKRCGGRPWVRGNDDDKQVLATCRSQHHTDPRGSVPTFMRGEADHDCHERPFDCVSNSQYRCRLRVGG
jgi:hypothetical protein